MTSEQSFLNLYPNAAFGPAAAVLSGKMRESGAIQYCIDLTEQVLGLREINPLVVISIRQRKQHSRAELEATLNLLKGMVNV